jgi:hypothetical protein
VKLRRRCQGGITWPWQGGVSQRRGLLARGLLVVWCVYVIVLYLDYPQCYPVSATERYIFSTGSKKIGCAIGDATVTLGMQQ